jgi:hypothetical protein
MLAGMIVLMDLMVLNIILSAVKIVLLALMLVLAEYLLPGIGEEYHYLFRNGEWVCYNMHEYANKLPEVAEIPTGALAA